MLLTITGCKSAANQTLCAGNTDVNKLHMNAHKKDCMDFTLNWENVHFFWSCDQFVTDLVAVWIPEMP